VSRRFAHIVLAFRAPGPSLEPALRPRFTERADLLRQFDALRRDLDASGTMPATDGFRQKAVSILTGEAARTAPARGGARPKRGWTSRNLTIR
jgi:hypothetical protein